MEALDIQQLRSHVIAAHNHGQLKQMSKSCKRTRKKKRQIIKLRKQRQKNGGTTAWVLLTPMEIRDDAAPMDLVKGFLSNLAKNKKSPTHTWDCEFRITKGLEQTINILGKCVHQEGCVFLHPRTRNLFSYLRGLLRWITNCKPILIELGLSG